MNNLFLLALGFFVVSSCSTFERKNEVLRKEVVINPGEARSKSSTEAPRKRVVILPIIDRTEIQSPTTNQVAQRTLILDLNKTGEVIALAQDDLQLDLNQKTPEGNYDLKKISAQAKDLSVLAYVEPQILKIRVTNAGDSVGVVRKLKTAIELDVQVRVFSTKGSKDVYSTVKTVRYIDENTRIAQRTEMDRFVKAQPELVQNMVKESFLEFTSAILSSLTQVEWEGRIAAIQGDRIFLNVGRISGVEIGDILKVTEAGDDIYDPQSGLPIGQSPGRMKGTLEVISYFGNDGAISIIHSGANFKENDKVEIY